jgi:hypothetical protein
MVMMAMMVAMGKFVAVFLGAAILVSITWVAACLRLYVLHIPRLRQNVIHYT